MTETEILGTLSKGASGADVKKAQEWLTLSGFGVVIDGQSRCRSRPPIRARSSPSGARAAGLFIPGSVEPAGFAPGYLFLLRGTSEPWHHVGIVRTIAPGAFTTIEGNSNDSGSADGYEVCSNARGWVDGSGVPHDFVRIA